MAATSVSRRVKSLSVSLYEREKLIFLPSMKGQAYVSPFAKGGRKGDFPNQKRGFYTPLSFWLISTLKQAKPSTISTV
jgi:hypothetical protein